MSELRIRREFNYTDAFCGSCDNCNVLCYPPSDTTSVLTVRMYKSCVRNYKAPDFFFVDSSSYSDTPSIPRLLCLDCAGTVDTHTTSDGTAIVFTLPCVSIKYNFEYIETMAREILDRKIETKEVMILYAMLINNMIHHARNHRYTHILEGLIYLRNNCITADVSEHLHESLSISVGDVLYRQLAIACSLKDLPRVVAKYSHDYFIRLLDIVTVHQRLQPTHVPGKGRDKALHTFFVRILTAIIFYNISYSRSSIARGRSWWIENVKHWFVRKIFTIRRGYPVCGTAKILSMADIASILPMSIYESISEFRLTEFSLLQVERFFNIPALVFAIGNYVYRTYEENAIDVYERLIASRDFASIVLSDSYEHGEQLVKQYLNNQYKRDVDDKHCRPIPFATMYGPSKLSCTACGYLFYTGSDNPMLMDIDKVNEAKQRRAEHFRNVYRADRSGLPTFQSAHYNIHRVVHGEHRLDVGLIENTERVMKRLLSGREPGNVYDEHMESTVAFVVQSFEPFASEWHARKPLGHPSFAEALRHELERRGARLETKSACRVY